MRKGSKMSKESRHKMRLAKLKSRHIPPSRIGIKHTKETRDKISKSTKGKNNPFYNKHHSKRAKAIMSKLKKGKSLSIEHRKKISEAEKGDKNWNWKGGISTENEKICRPCHKKFHMKYKFRDNTKEQLEEFLKSK